jgi:hypothetical protein
LKGEQLKESTFVTMIVVGIGTITAILFGEKERSWIARFDYYDDDEKA